MVFDHAAQNAPDAGARARIASTARRRTQLRAMRLLFSSVAAFALAYVGYWWWVHSREQMVSPEIVQAAGKSAAPVVLDQLKYDGKDDRGRPYSILAQSASHPQNDSKHIALEKPSADMILSGGAYVAVNADKGLLDREDDMVTLEGNVHVMHDNGLSFETEKAQVDLNTKEASGQMPVEGQNRDGELIAEGFRILDEGRVVQFTGRAYLKLYGGKPAAEGQTQ